MTRIGKKLAACALGALLAALAYKTRAGATLDTLRRATPPEETPGPKKPPAIDMGAVRAASTLNSPVVDALFKATPPPHPTFTPGEVAYATQLIAQTDDSMGGVGSVTPEEVEGAVQATTDTTPPLTQGDER